MFAYCDNNPIINLDENGYLCNVNLPITDGEINNPNGNPYAYVVSGGSGALVVDFSLSAGSCMYIKVGASLVIDPLHENNGFYFHLGCGGGISSGPSGSVGYVENYKEPKDYKGMFVDSFASLFVGGDYCFSPNNGKGQVKAYSLTVGTGKSIGLGADYYFTIHDLLSGRVVREILAGFIQQLEE